MPTSLLYGIKKIGILQMNASQGVMMSLQTGNRNKEGTGIARMPSLIFIAQYASYVIIATAVVFERNLVQMKMSNEASVLAGVLLSLVSFRYPSSDINQI